MHTLHMLPPVDTPALPSIPAVDTDDTPTLLLICPPYCRYTHPAVEIRSPCRRFLLSILTICPSCCRYAHPAVDMPILLSICPSCCRYVLSLIHRPCCRSLLSIPTIRPSCCWCAHPVVDTPALLSICPTVDTPALLSIPTIRPPCHRYTHLLSPVDTPAPLCPYRHTCTRCRCCGPWCCRWRGGGADAHIPQGGEGHEWRWPQLAWLDAKCVFASGGTWVELAGGGRNNPTVSSHRWQGLL